MYINDYKQYAKYHLEISTSESSNTNTFTIDPWPFNNYQCQYYKNIKIHKWYRNTDVLQKLKLHQHQNLIQEQQNW